MRSPENLLKVGNQIDGVHAFKGVNVHGNPADGIELTIESSDELSIHAAP
jgi:hypothetical protein